MKKNNYGDSPGLKSYSYFNSDGALSMYKSLVGVYKSIGHVSTISKLDYYVSTTGSDTTGDGTEANPFRTLYKAMTYAMSVPQTGLQYTTHFLLHGSRTETLQYDFPDISDEGDNYKFFFEKSYVIEGFDSDEGMWDGQVQLNVYRPLYINHGNMELYALKVVYKGTDPTLFYDDYDGIISISAIGLFNTGAGTTFELDPTAVLPATNHIAYLLFKGNVIGNINSNEVDYPIPIDCDNKLAYGVAVIYGAELKAEGLKVDNCNIAVNNDDGLVFTPNIPTGKITGNHTTTLTNLGNSIGYYGTQKSKLAYHIDLNADGNGDGSEAKPFKSLNEAISKLKNTVWSLPQVQVHFLFRVSPTSLEYVNYDIDLTTYGTTTDIFSYEQNMVFEGYTGDPEVKPLVNLNLVKPLLIGHGKLEIYNCHVTYNGDNTVDWSGADSCIELPESSFYTNDVVYSIAPTAYIPTTAEQFIDAGLSDLKIITDNYSVDPDTRDTETIFNMNNKIGTCISLDPGSTINFNQIEINDCDTGINNYFGLVYSPDNDYGRIRGNVRQAVTNTGLKSYAYFNSDGALSMYKSLVGVYKSAGQPSKYIYYINNLGYYYDDDGNQVPIDPNTPKNGDVDKPFFTLDDFRKYYYENNVVWSFPQDKIFVLLAGSLDPANPQSYRYFTYNDDDEYAEAWNRFSFEGANIHPGDDTNTWVRLIVDHDTDAVGVNHGFRVFYGIDLYFDFPDGFHEPPFGVGGLVSIGHDGALYLSGSITLSDRTPKPNFPDTKFYGVHIGEDIEARIHNITINGANKLDGGIRVASGSNLQYDQVTINDCDIAINNDPYSYMENGAWVYGNGPIYGTVTTKTPTFISNVFGYYAPTVDEN
ncbi:MAG: hypothetical protein EZS28_029780, partial [Streblomastix strix]